MKPNVKELEEKVKFYEYIFNNINALVWINHAEGRVLWHNKRTSDMLEHSIEEINEIGIEEYSKNYFYPDDKHLFEESLKYLVDRNIGHFTSIYRQKDKNGDWVKILANSKVSKWQQNGFPEEVVSCGIVISEELADFTKIESLLKENTCLKTIIKLKDLTKREMEILKCITQGKSTKQIAEDKFISFHTVESHRKNIMRKLNLHNLADLVRLATECGVY